MFSVTTPSNKANIFEKDWSNFDQENFFLDYFSIDWDVALKLDEQNAKKAELHLQYKNHRNLLATLLKQNKENYYKKCFESNWNNAKIIWKGIKSIITLKDITSSVPRTISQEKILILMILLTSSITIFLPLLILLRRTLSILINTFQIFSITSAIILHLFSLLTVMK